MGSRYKALCKECHFRFELTKGGGWAWYLKLCNICGDATRVPRKGPAWFVGDQMSSEDMFKHLASPEGWSRNGGVFDSTEQKMLDEMTRSCSCGGHMVPEWDSNVRYCCPVCKGVDLDLSDEILFD